ncbi:hypothetical protein A0127_06245 [Thermococcus peptonophilus]|uniref:Tyr recombinase domain-containing protein n=2 Tax=Thermococcus peptonophilus TaxID=53952 RepID=A0A142CVJ8_9EURY|nr:hypothetical protein A0127_06245 [Thermococcus peptonophilus]
MMREDVYVADELRRLKQQMLDTQLVRQNAGVRYITVFESDFDRFVEFKRDKGITANWLRKIERFFKVDFINYVEENYPDLIRRQYDERYIVITRNLIVNFLRHLFRKYSYSSYEKYYHMFFDFLDFYTAFIETVSDVEAENAIFLKAMKKNFSPRKLVSPNKLRAEREARTLKDVSLEDIKKSIEVIFQLYLNELVTDNFTLSSALAYVVLSTTGMRFNDLQQVKVSDIDFKEKVIWGQNTKIGLPEIYFLTDEATELIKFYINWYGLNNDDKLFQFVRLDEQLRKTRKKLYTPQTLAMAYITNNTIVKKLYPLQLKFCKKAYANRLLAKGVSEPHISLLTHHRRKDVPVPVQKTIYEHYLNRYPHSDAGLREELRSMWYKAFKDVKLLPRDFFLHFQKELIKE